MNKLKLNQEQIKDLHHVIRSVVFSIRQWQDEVGKVMKDVEVHKGLEHKLTWYQLDMLHEFNKYTWSEQWIYISDIIDVLQDVEDKFKPDTNYSGNISDLLFYTRELYMVLDGLHQLYLVSEEAAHGLINAQLDEAAVTRCMEELPRG